MKGMYGSIPVLVLIFICILASLFMTITGISDSCDDGCDVTIAATMAVRIAAMMAAMIPATVAVT